MSIKIYFRGTSDLVLPSVLSDMITSGDSKSVSTYLALTWVKACILSDHM